VLNHLLGLGLWLQFALTPGTVPPPATGLHFVPPETLRGIPLAELPYAGFELPTRVDLSADMPPPGYQGKQNSCVAWVSAYAVKTYQEKIEKRHLLISQGQPQWQHIFSPAFVYNQINQGRDGGATLVDALNLLSARGALSWSEMPYDSDNHTRQPSAQQLQAAKIFRIAYWRQVNVADPQELKAHLQAGYPIMIGALIDQGLHQLRGQAIWKRKAGKSLGGHALVLVGYDDRRRAFKVMNSWGPDWAAGGYGWIDYTYFRKVVREGYVAKDAPTQPPAAVASLKRERDEQPLGNASSAGASPPAPQPMIAPEKPAQPERSQDLDEWRSQSETRKLAAAQASESEAAKEKTDFEETPGDLAKAQVFPHLSLEQPSYAQGQLWFSGQFQVGPENGQVAQVLVNLFTDATGEQPLKIADPVFSLPNGQGLAPGALQNTQTGSQSWVASVPLAYLPAGHHSLWAQAVLYVDKFGISRGELIEVKLPRVD